MAVGTFLICNEGLRQKQKLFCGLSASPCKYVGLDGDGSALSATQLSPAQELTVGGAGRREMAWTDISTTGDYAVQGQVDYEFTGPNTILAIFIAWSSQAGNNMYGRGLLSAAQAVDDEDILTIKYRDHGARAT